MNVINVPVDDKEIDAWMKWMHHPSKIGGPASYVGTWVKSQKYSPDQPRVPAGSPEGGRWAGTEISAGYTADIGGMELARKHEQTIYKLAGSTDSYGDEHAVTIGSDGKASKIIRGNGKSVRIPPPEIGIRGTIHTHPAQERAEPSCPSPNDIAMHMRDAWNSENENYTTIVASLSTGDARVKVYAVKGWPRGGPVNVTEVAQKLYDFMAAHTTAKHWQTMSEEEYVRGVNEMVKTVATTVYGLEWEEAWFD